MAQISTPVPGTFGRTRRTAAVAVALTIAAVVAAALWASRGAPSDSGGLASALTDREASDIAAGYFRGYNDGDYVAFSQHFDAAMKDTITEDVFTAWHRQTFPLLGAHVATTDVERVAAQTARHITWMFTADFAEEQDVVVRLTFPSDGTQIAGAHVLSDKLGTR
jgi:hypothetical protein